MNTLIRNSTLALSRRHEQYQSLDQPGDSWGTQVSAARSKSKSSKSRREPQQAMQSLSYRRKRLKSRQIYLQSYKLTSKKTHAECRSRALKKGLVKAKSAMVKLVAFFRFDSLRSSGLGKRASPSLWCYSGKSIGSQVAA